MSEEFKTLNIRCTGPTLDVQFNSPETGNAVTETVLDELLALLNAVHEQPEIRVLVISGAGSDFCVGGDRLEFRRSLADDPGGSLLRTIGGKAKRVCDALASINAVTIARLQGQVIGAGLALALFCDLRAGADTCRFRLPELALGLPVAWGGALPRLLNEVGAARIRELMLTGEAFDAAKAEQLSILHRVVPEDELDGVVEQWVKPVVRRSAGALRTTKTMLNAFTSANRMADITLVDAEFMASVAASERLGRF